MIHLCHIFIILLLIASTPAYAESSYNYTAESLLKYIKEHGARDTIKAKLNNWSEWEKLLDKIESGKKEWVQVAYEIRKGTDASYTTGLIVTMAYALPNSPQNVLTIIGSEFNINKVCGFPFIEPTDAQLIVHYNKTLNALNQVNSKELKALVNACISQLEIDKKYIQTGKENNYKDIIIPEGWRLPNEKELQATRALRSESP